MKLTLLVIKHDLNIFHFLLNEGTYVPSVTLKKILAKVKSFLLPIYYHCLLLTSCSTKLPT